MFKLPFFGKKKLLLAFEYAIVIAKTAQDVKLELTKELIEKSEAMILNEFKNKNAERLSVEMIPNILSMFEPK